MGVDACFLRDANTTALLTILVAYIKPWKLWYAFAVSPNRGNMPAIELLSKLLQESNLATFAYRSDREPAIRTLMKDAIKMSRTTGYDATDDDPEDIMPDEYNAENKQSPDEHAEPRHLLPANTNPDADKSKQPTTTT